MNPVTRFRTTRVKPCRLFGVAFLALVLCACGGEAGNEAETQAVPGETSPARDTVGAPADQAGAFELGGTSYPFRIVSCDFSGNDFGGMLLHGTGTTPDGRTLTIQVERLERGDLTQEGVFVMMGGMPGGEVWTADMVRHPDGRWFVGQGMNEPAEGPLLQISGNELLVEGTFLHETDGTARDGVLRATCAS